MSRKKVKNIIRVVEDFIAGGLKMQKVLVRYDDDSEEVITIPAIGEWES